MTSTDTEEARYAKLKRYMELKRDRALFFYKPYPKQADFHAAGLTKRERLLMAGNRLGKTYSAGFETTMHTTGLYPDWWTGYRTKKHSRGWVGSVTAELTRDGAQRILLGPVGHWGEGCIPKDCIVDIKRARGIPDAVETILVRHINKQISQITFKAYSDGRESWQAEELDWVWFDEEPPEDIYIEGVTRTNNTTGPCYLTFTPLLGMSSVVLRFWDKSDHPDRSITGMTIEDVTHYTDEQKAKIIAQYPEHELEARSRGIPMLGEGRIFQVAEEVIREDPIVMIPSHWKQIIGMDFGWDHPTAAVHLLYDESADCIHIHQCHRQKKELPIIHSAALKPWGAWVPVSWPRDGSQTDRGSGEQTSKLYKEHGMSMLSEAATFPDDRGVAVEAGILEMQERMRTSRWKVSKNCWQWWEEYRMYHRKDGKIVKEREDTLCASRYAMMMLRFALPAEYAPKPRDRYQKGGYHAGGTWMSS